MSNLIGPILIFLGVAGLSFGVYLLLFANRAKNTDRRTGRQKNLDAIAEMRGDKKKAAAPKAARHGGAKKK